MHLESVYHDVVKLHQIPFPSLFPDLPFARLPVSGPLRLSHDERMPQCLASGTSLFWIQI